MRSQVRPLLWGLSAAALFGASAPLAKILLADASPLCLAGLLYLGAGAATLPFAVRRGWAPWRLDAPNRWRLIGAACFGGAIAPILLLAGLSLAPAGSVSLWLAFEMPATALLASWFFHEHVGLRMWMAVVVTGLASVLLAAPDRFAFAPAALLVAAACVCWAVDNNLTSLIDRSTPVQTTAVKGLTAGTVNLSLGLWSLPHLPHLSTIAAALAVGAVGYGFSLVLYINAAQHLGATRSQVIFASAPFWGVAFSCILLGELISGVQAGAGILTMVAVILMRSERHSHTHDHEGLVHTHRHRHDDESHGHDHTDVPGGAWHTHVHTHPPLRHAHDHRPDLHHRHDH